MIYENKSYMNCGNEMKMKKWSSQWTQFMQLRKEAWKKIQDFNGVWTRDLAITGGCPTNWAMTQLTLGAGQLWVPTFTWKKWVLMIYENKSYMNCGNEMKMKKWSSQWTKFMQLPSWCTRAARIRHRENNRHVDIILEPFNELKEFPLLLIRAYINRYSICKAYKGLKETTTTAKRLDVCVRTIRNWNELSAAGLKKSEMVNHLKRLIVCLLTEISR